MNLRTFSATLKNLEHYLMKKKPDQQVIKLHLNLIQLHMEKETVINDYRYPRQLLRSLTDAIQDGSTQKGTLKLVMILRNAIKKRGVKLEGPMKDQVFHDHHLLACARHFKNESVAQMVQELINKQNGMQVSNS